MTKTNSYFVDQRGLSDMSAQKIMKSNDVTDVDELRIKIYYGLNIFYFVFPKGTWHQK